jgi:hypothetical protein
MTTTHNPAVERTCAKSRAGRSLLRWALQIMSELIPHRRAPVEVEAPLVSAGLGRGPHTWLAIALAIAGVVLGLIARSSAAPAFIFAACGTGLVGEVPRLLRTGEVRARRFHSVRFLIIRRDDSPTHFYFHVLAYLLLGGFCLMSACFFFAQVIAEHVG